MKYNIKWSGLADKKYWEYIAQYCVPSWKTLPGEKYIITDSKDITLSKFNLIDWERVPNLEAKFLKLTNRLKPLNFWRKMQSQVWAIRNLTDCDFLVLLDTDIEILDFNKDMFFKEIDKLIESNHVWATGESNRRGHDSGFIVLNMSHPKLKELTDYYENIWETGNIFKLDKWYDGHAVESMFEVYPSYKIQNRDYGSGLHLYELGLVHYGSKLPKQLRAEWKSDGKSLVEKRLSEIAIKQYKNDIA
jgi:hypothetical protein